MKKNWFMRIGAAALVVGVMSMSMVGGTFAKYATTVSGTGTATVAAWSFKAGAKDGATSSTETFTVALDSNKIMPGASGSFGIDVDAAGSDTGVDYAVKITNIQYKPTNLKFYKEAEHTNEITNLETEESFKGTIASDDATKKKTVTVYWQWLYEADGADNTANDAADLADQGKSMSFDVTVTGTQVNPTAAPTT